jgi:hypothetical protein
LLCVRPCPFPRGFSRRLKRTQGPQDAFRLACLTGERGTPDAEQGGYGSDARGPREETNVDVPRKHDAEWLFP